MVCELRFLTKMVHSWQKVSLHSTSPLSSGLWRYARIQKGIFVQRFLRKENNQYSFHHNSTTCRSSSSCCLLFFLVAAFLMENVVCSCCSCRSCCFCSCFLFFSLAALHLVAPAAVHDLSLAPVALDVLFALVALHLVLLPFVSFLCCFMILSSCLSSSCQCFPVWCCPGYLIVLVVMVVVVIAVVSVAFVSAVGTVSFLLPIHTSRGLLAHPFQHFQDPLALSQLHVGPPCRPKHRSIQTASPSLTAGRTRGVECHGQRSNGNAASLYT